MPPKSKAVKFSELFADAKFHCPAGKKDPKDAAKTQ